MTSFTLPGQPPDPSFVRAGIEWVMYAHLQCEAQAGRVDCSSNFVQTIHILNLKETKNTCQEFCHVPVNGKVL